jgi:hypothetical protein
MKNIKICSLVAIVLAAFTYAQYADALTVSPQPTMLYMSPTAVAPTEDDDHEDPDEGGDQCLLIFPFCEAHIV